MAGQVKSFSEYIQDCDTLNEGVIRSGAIATYGARARSDGDKALRAYDEGKRALRSKTGDGGLEERLDRLETALEALFDGLKHQRGQIGNGVAASVSGHLLASRVREQRRGRR